MVTDENNVLWSSQDLGCWLSLQLYMYTFVKLLLADSTTEIMNLKHIVQEKYNSGKRKQ